MPFSGSFSQEFVSENLGQNINSQYGDFQPVISPDGNTLYFSRYIGKQEIWFSQLDSAGQWKPAQKLDVILNKSLQNAVCGASPDNNTLLIAGSYHEGKVLKETFLFLRRARAGWSKPQPVKIKNLHDKKFYRYLTASWSVNGKVMMMQFAGTNPEDADLYVSFLEENGEWSEPVNAGPDINTKYGERIPFIAADGISLYFASNRPGGVGDYDIYVTKRLDDSWKKWSVPVNMGTDINTKGIDDDFTISAKGDYAFMSSTQNSLGFADIIRIKLAEDDRPEPVVLVTGKVYNARTGLPMTSHVVYETLPGGTEVGLGNSSIATGEYSIILPKGKKYGFRAQSHGFLSISNYLDLTGVKEYEVIKRDLYLTPLENGQNARLNNIFFPFNNYSISPESYPELDRLSSVLKNYHEMEIEIAGYTDNVGDERFNERLSLARAESVKKYLISKGLDKRKITAKGYGEKLPIGGNHTEEGRMINRRVEIRILKM
jgi:outer membrane protein OmpA-like peptidoglycan-associated protein